MAQLPGIGVFGTGTAVRCLVPLLKSCGFRVEALWGRTKEQAEECARDLEICFKTNEVDDVLLHKNVDLVFINCPPNQQTPIAVKALGIGKHVICGMPAGPTGRDALRMVLGARYYPLLMSLMCNGLRFLPCFVKMKNMIDDGYLGEITVCEVRVHCGSSLKDKFDWMCDELMGGGVLNIHGTVMIDLISYLTGYKASRVQGLLKTYTKKTDKIKGIRQITSDDFCSFQLELDKGACATVILNGHLPGQYMHEVLVCGTKGHLVVRGSDLYGQKNDWPKEEALFKDAPNILDHHNSGVSESIRADIPITHLKGLIKLIDSVKDAFKSIEEKHSWSRNPVAIAATFEDSHYIQSVVDCIRRSNKNQEWVKFELAKDPPDPTERNLAEKIKQSNKKNH